MLNEVEVRCKVIWNPQKVCVRGNIYIHIYTYLYLFIFKIDALASFLWRLFPAQVKIIFVLMCERIFGHRETCFANFHSGY